MAGESLQTKNYWLQQQLNGAAAFIALALLFVTLRSLAQWLNPKRKISVMGEITIIGALITFLILTICEIVSAKAYKAWFASHTKEEEIKHFVVVYKTAYIISAMYPLACALPKLALCSLYLTLFGVNDRLRIITQTTMVLIAMNAIAWFVPSVAVCHPISQYWSIAGHKGRCIDIVTFGTWITLPHIVTDLIMVALPIFPIWRLQRRATERFGAILVLLTGSAGIVGACLRLAFYIHHQYIEHAGATQTTKAIAVNNIVSYLEPGMYLIAACLPSLAQIIKYLRRDRSSGSLPWDQSSNVLKRVVSPRINLKLTGVGNLQTLAEDVEAIELTGK